MGVNFCFQRHSSLFLQQTALNLGSLYAGLTAAGETKNLALSVDGLEQASIRGGMQGTCRMHTSADRSARVSFPIPQGHYLHGDNGAVLSSTYKVAGG